MQRAANTAATVVGPPRSLRLSCRADDVFIVRRLFDRRDSLPCSRIDCSRAHPGAYLKAWKRGGGCRSMRATLATAFRLTHHRWVWADCTRHRAAESLPGAAWCNIRGFMGRSDAYRLSTGRFGGALVQFVLPCRPPPNPRPKPDFDPNSSSRSLIAASCNTVPIRIPILIPSPIPNLNAILAPTQSQLRLESRTLIPDPAP